MISYWLCNNAPVSVKQVDYILPAVGHSCLPPDCVFRRIATGTRKEDIFIQPEESTYIFSELSTADRWLEKFMTGKLDITKYSYSLKTGIFNLTLAKVSFL